MQSQSLIGLSLQKALTIGETNRSPRQSAFEIMTEKAVFLRQEDRKKTKPSIFENPFVLQRLAVAFSMGGTIEEAAQFACCSVSTVKKHIRERTPFLYVTPWGEECIRTFDEMVTGWRCYLPMLAKRRICEAIDSPDLKIATKNAWKYLERHEPNEWGGICRDCLRRGVKVY